MNKRFKVYLGVSLGIAMILGLVFMFSSESVEARTIYLSSDYGKLFDDGNDFFVSNDELTAIMYKMRNKRVSSSLPIQTIIDVEIIYQLKRIADALERLN